MKKTILYPFTADSYPIVKYFNKFSSVYKLVSVVALSGSGLCSKDVSFAENRKDPLNFNVGQSLSDELTCCDALFVPFGKRDCPAYLEIIETMEATLRLRKDVLCAAILSDEEKDSLYELSENMQVNFIHYSTETYSDIRNNKVFEKIKIPVVVIGNSICDANDFEILLTLTNRLQQDGYKTTSVGFAPELNFFGMYALDSLVEAFYNGILTENIGNVISKINHEIYSLVLYEKPDILLIQSPGGMIHTNDFYVNECGVFGYLLSCAVKPDYAICCMPYGYYNSDILKEISCDVKNRLGYSVNSFHVSNKAINHMISSDRREICTFYQPESVLTNVISKMETHMNLYNLLDTKQFEKMYSHMINFFKGSEYNGDG